MRENFFNLTLLLFSCSKMNNLERNELALSSARVVLQVMTRTEALDAYKNSSNHNMHLFYVPLHA